MWNLGDLPSIVKGAWAAPPDSAVANAPFDGVSIDSREIHEGDVFIAMRGDRTDGHAFIDGALEAGAAATIACRSELNRFSNHERVILVDDTGEALKSLAHAWRRALPNTTVIAVTGSNGKTTTCRLIHAALSSTLKGVRSRRSFNNHLGVPLTILRARPDDTFLVCEIGANAPGEITALGELAKPDIAVITSVGRAHVGGFGGLAAIVREKSSLARCVGEGGVVFAPDAPESLVTALSAMPADLALVGHSDRASLRLRRVGHETTTTEHALRIDLADGATFTAPVIGRHNAINVACAVAVARRLGVYDASIQRGLRAVELPAMRQQILELGGVRVFNDAYNANPDSMRAAIATFLDLTRDAGRRVLVLGDMLELGDDAGAAHAEILGAALGDRAIDAVITVGPEFARTAAADARLTRIADPSNEAMRRIVSMLQPGDAALLKGSRLLRLERIAELLQADSARPHPVAP